ncbi:hypothetical protein F9L07_00910 [Pimelobacter simplex]|uniref:Lipoprotein n=1 Tax=Nocardioides simplex TaxID=2045 RepID=A0A7J5DX05_NOCSI|nr:hypothetical protein [Pimelobacter simplex]KAB2810562.1 hypothetical protein F9L07_00910 [Pimelobacter simplex]
MRSRSLPLLPRRPRLLLLAGALAVATALSACSDIEPGSEGVGGRLDAAGWKDQQERNLDEAIDEVLDLEVEPGSKDGAQALMTSAERRFLEDPSAHFRVYWYVGGEVETPIEGRFDLAQPAAEVQTGPDEENRYEVRLRGDDTWMRATVDGRAMDCWLHASGTAAAGGPAGVTYQAMLLVEPVAVGHLVDGGDDYPGAEVGDRVVLDLPLAATVPAVIPRLGGVAAKPIDAKATVRGLAVVGVNGRVTSIEVAAADLFAALRASRTGMPSELRPLAKDPYVRAMSAEISYHDYGTEVRVAAPPQAKVADLGRWQDLLADAQDPSGGGDGAAPSCEAALAGS